MVVELRTLDGGALALDASESPSWCSVALNQQGGEIALGADSTSVVVMRLLDALTPPVAPPPNGFKWRLSLSDLHGVLYFRWLGGDIDILVQNAAGEEVGRLMVHPEQRVRWIRQLSAMLS